MRIELDLEDDDALALMRWLECAGMTRAVVSVSEQIEVQRKDSDSRSEDANRIEENKGEGQNVR